MYKGWEKQIGKWTENFGIGWFLVSFWMPFGFHLGGNPTFLGPFNHQLEILFPISGIGILLVIFGKLLTKTLKQLTLSHLIFVFSFLGICIITSYFSVSPISSILFCAIWGMGFLTTSFKDSFQIKNKWKRLTLALSIALGMILSITFPDINISKEILAMGSILGIIFLMREEFFSLRILFLFFYTLIVYLSGHLPLTLIAFLVLLSVNIWSHRPQREINFKQAALPTFFLLALTIWGMIISSFNTYFSIQDLPPIFSNFSNFLFGVGEGQYLIGVQMFSDTLLLPNEISIPSSGIILTFFEKGLVGLLALVFLFLSSFLYTQKKTILFTMFILSFLMFTKDIIITETGILFFMTFLFVEEKNLVTW